MLQVSVKELTESAFQREASKMSNNCIKKTLHYIQEADINVYNIELYALNVTSMAETSGDHVYIVFSDDNKIIRSMELDTSDFMDLVIR